MRCSLERRERAHAQAPDRGRDTISNVPALLAREDHAAGSAQYSACGQRRHTLSPLRTRRECSRHAGWGSRSETCSVRLKHWRCVCEQESCNCRKSIQTPSRGRRQSLRAICASAPPAAVRRTRPDTRDKSCRHVASSCVHASELILCLPQGFSFYIF